jgi:shikimate kinase
VSNIAQSLDRPIVLVGSMGAGKTTAGRLLAGRLSLPFIDCDTAIEQAAGCSVAEIFERFGEQEFRERERRMIEHLVDGGVSVIATGGGAFVDGRSRAMLNRRAITVWLDAPVAVLAARTADEKSRPLLRTADPAASLERLSAERRPFYRQAHVRVDSGRRNPDQLVDAIVGALNDYLHDHAAASAPDVRTTKSPKRSPGPRSRA